jgi:DNA-binding beta-propeller fold protein YncE
MRKLMLMASTAIVSGLVMGTALASSPYEFKLMTKIPLPTQKGHGDWVAFDPANQDIYVSLKGHGMAVVDTKTNKVVHAFQDIEAPNTMTFDKNYIYETAAEGAGAGKVNQVVVIDKKDWKIVDRVTTKGTSPDGTFIDPANHDLYVVSDDNNWIEKYTSGAHPKFITKYRLQPAKPQNGPDVANLFNGTIYATDDADVETVDPNTGKIGTLVDYHFKQNKFGGTKDMVWDLQHHVIWCATTNHAMMLLDPKTLIVEKFLPEQAGADGVAIDRKLGLLYAFQGAIPGFDVYSTKDEKWLATVKTGTAKPTHSGAVDPASDEVYAYVGGDAALYVYKPETATTAMK